MDCQKTREFMIFFIPMRKKNGVANLICHPICLPATTFATPGWQLQNFNGVATRVHGVDGVATKLLPYVPPHLPPRSEGPAVLRMR